MLQKNVKNKYKNLTQKIQSQYKKAKRRFEIAQQVISKPPRPRTRSPMNRESSVVTPIRKHTLSKKQDQKRLDKANAKISELEKKLSEANLRNAQLEKQPKVLKQAGLNNKKRITNLQNKLREENKKEFSHANLISQPNLFQYLCGLNVDQFNMILDCALPYIHLIPYPDSVGGTGHRRLGSTTELLLVLTICRHRLHQGIMDYIVEMSNATVQRIFCGWVIRIYTEKNAKNIY